MQACGLSDAYEGGEDNIDNASTLAQLAARDTQAVLSPAFTTVPGKSKGMAARFFATFKPSKIRMKRKSTLARWMRT